jgi:hypothetical protein
LALASVSSCRHGVPEPRFTWMHPAASLRVWMPAVHAGMTDAVPDCQLNLSPTSASPFPSTLWEKACHTRHRIAARANQEMSSLLCKMPIPVVCRTRTRGPLEPFKLKPKERAAWK